MKILSCMFGINKGGIEQVFIDHDKTFMDLGHNTAVLASKNFKDLEQVASKNRYIFKNKSLYNPATYIRVIKYINSYNPDLVFMHGNRAIDMVCNRFVKPFIKNKDIKYIATTHNYRNKRFSKLDYALVISNDLKKDLVSRGFDKDKIFKCVNAVNLQNQATGYKYHKTPVIGTLGRLHSVKGYDILIKSFAKAMSNGIKAKLLIAGSGEERSNLEELIENLGLNKHVKISPWVENKKEFFKKIDIFCLSSKSEALSISLLEAQSFSKPAIITNCAGPMEVIKENNSGIIAKRDNITSLAKAIEDLVSDEKLGKNMSTAAHKTIQDSYSKDSLKKNLKEILRNLQK